MTQFKTTCHLVVLAAVWGCLFGSVRGDDLEEVRESVRNPSSTPSTATTSKSSSGSSPKSQDSFATAFDDDDAVDGDLSTTLVKGAVIVAAAPFWGPIWLSGDDYSSAGYFPRYPYQRPLNGHMMIDPDLPRHPRDWFGRAYFDFRTNFDDLTVWGGGLQLDTTTRFGLDASAHTFLQDLPGGGHDQLTVGSGDLLFRFVQSSWLEMRTGIGVNWLTDSVRDDWGVNFTYGGDWFPVRPLVVSVDLDLGKLGHASLFHARVTTGIQVKRAEFYVGYDYLDIGSADFNTGIAGVRLSF